MAMTTTLRRSQSLKCLSESHRSWVIPEPILWDRRKSVTLLVQQFQSCVDLNKVGTETAPVQCKPKSNEIQEHIPDPSRRGHESTRATYGGGSSLKRSRSMEALPQRAPVGTSALRALFESKSTLKQACSSSPRLTATPPAKKSPVSHITRTGEETPAAGRGRDCAAPSTPTVTVHQNHLDRERRRTVVGVPSLVRDEARTFPGNLKDAPSNLGQDWATVKASTPTVKARSALYLSKAAAADSPGPATQLASVEKHTVVCGNKAKQSKMAEIAKQIRVTEASNGVEDLPPPPPPPPRQHFVESPISNVPGQSDLPVPPPKETFSSFYQQRQKSELKRLFKHIHPELRKNIDEVVEDEIVGALNLEKPSEIEYQAEVQSMRWIFENWTLDNIGDPHSTKRLLDEENPQGGDVRGTSSVFEHSMWDRQQTSSSHERQGLVKGDVRTATWLFETQPMHSLGKSNMEEGELVEAVLKEPIQKGDVKGARLLFETRPLDALGHCSSVEDQSFLTLKSELQEQRGDVKKTLKLFQADPSCALYDGGNIHEIKSICREEIQSSNMKRARWLFETQPLDLINKESSTIKIIRGISLEEAQTGGTDKKRWIFETQPLDSIHEGSVEQHRFQGTVEEYASKADVEHKCKLFDTHPLSTLKGESTVTDEVPSKEEIVGGNVQSTLWLFETQPMDTLKDSYEVGCLKKVEISSERGKVTDKKLTFENFSASTSESKRDEVEEVRGDVQSFRNLFETIPLSQISHAENQQTATHDSDITKGNVKSNCTLFETTPLYAMKDPLGNFHEVTTVSREEVIKGNVQNYKWMFETRPIDQFDEGTGKVEVIKGITRQEDVNGEVRSAKWMFETQPLDRIHLKFNQKQENSSVQLNESQKGDVKTCKWLFETQPMDILYEKSERKQDVESVPKANVKSHTWLFETKPLDNIKDKDEIYLNLCSTFQDDLRGDVKTATHLFETETLDRIQKRTDSDQDVRFVSQIDVRSGDVSRVKEIFETKSLDEIGSECTALSNIENNSQHIQPGSVHKFTWLFENQPMSSINDKEETSIRSITDVEAGDVGNKKFIFETFSLDKIQDKDKLLEHKATCVEMAVSSVDVKSSTMLFESQPLYAIKDKDGQYHEVTTVKKEEVMSGDVRGARWMFETKPLDSIQADKEIYVIRAVTQEDVQKGDVKSARWRFETQPLDSLTQRDTQSVRVVEDMGNVNYVQQNKQLFESEQAAHKKCVRMVSVTDIQQGDVRTSTWLFENQPIDSLKGESHDQEVINTVNREDNEIGDVKRCTWLFESQPLDKIKDSDSSVENVAHEEIPKANVQSTTWLFETTPLDRIVVESVTDTLSYLNHLNFVHSSGIIIQANDDKNVSMAKYNFEGNEGPMVQKEEIIEGNIRNIMLQLLLRPNLKPVVILLEEKECGNVQKTLLDIPFHEAGSSANSDIESRIEKVTQTIGNVFLQNKSTKTGVVMQESDEGHPEMTIYSLYSQSNIKMESHDIERGDVRSTIGNLLATAQNQRVSASWKLEENEKGNVDLYRTCIEKGDLQYLKNLQAELTEDDVSIQREQIEIVQGDVKEAKRNLNQQKEPAERTILDIVPGDVRTTKRVFSSGSVDQNFDTCVPKEEIMHGDILSAKHQLSEAVKQPIIVPKEEIVSGDIKAMMESLEQAKQRSMHLEREVVTPGTIFDLDVSMQESSMDEMERQMVKEEIISGDVKAAKKSLEMAKNQSMRVERQTVVPGKIYNLNVSSREQDESTVKQSTASSSSVNQRNSTTYRKVSDTEQALGASENIDICHQNEVGGHSNVIHVSKSEVDPTVLDSEIVGGDVKATILSLHNAAAEQKAIEKEEIVKGNMEGALQSLERSSVNVSKGDYKTAMLYRKSAQSYRQERKKDVGSKCKHSDIVSMPPSDDELSCSVSVTEREHRPTTLQNSTAMSCLNSEETSSQLSNSLTNKAMSPPPLPPKVCDQRPALPPKPIHLSNNNFHVPANPSGSTNASRHIPIIPPKTEPEKQSPPFLPQKSSSHRKDCCDHSQCTDNTNEKTNEGAHNKDSFQIAPRKKSQICKKSLFSEEYNQTEQQNCTGVSATERSSTSPSTTVEIDRKVIQKINAVEDISRCYSEDSNMKQEMNKCFQTALQNFGGKKKGTANTTPCTIKKVKVVCDEASKDQQVCTTETQHIHTLGNGKDSLVTPYSSSLPNVCNDSCNIKFEHPKQDSQVVLREKKVRSETEDERLQRLSVHKEEILRGNVQTAMEIFENLRKREELKIILSRVGEIEGETCEVDVKSLKTLFENVPVWVASPVTSTKHGYPASDKKIPNETEEISRDDTEFLRDDVESVSSVEAAFEDLEKASMDIMKLKEQTLAKLMDIEETIKKALYSVSNLKSEADIAGLSGLFTESLRTEPASPTTNNIRKISIVSSKTKSEPAKVSIQSNSDSKTQSARQPKVVPSHTQVLPSPKPCLNPPSSPSFISIHSAARKPTESVKHFAAKSNECHQTNVDCDRSTDKNDIASHFCSPQNPRRKVSILEVQTIPEATAGIIGTKTVSEKYEETDCFGNRYVSSKTSTFVTKQSETETSSSYEVVSNPGRCEGVASPRVRRTAHGFAEYPQSNNCDSGKVFVTFGHSKKGKH